MEANPSQSKEDVEQATAFLSAMTATGKLTRGVAVALIGHLQWLLKG